MRNRWSMAFRLLGVMTLALTASLGAVAALTGLSPSRLLDLVPAGGASARPTKAGPAGVADAPRAIPIYSDGWFDDSGIAIATDFEAPVTDPSSLAQVARCAKGPGRAGDRPVRARARSPRASTVGPATRRGPRGTGSGSAGCTCSTAGSRRRCGPSRPPATIHPARPEAVRRQHRGAARRRGLAAG